MWLFGFFFFKGEKEKKKKQKRHQLSKRDILPNRNQPVVPRGQESRLLFPSIFGFLFKGGRWESSISATGGPSSHRALTARRRRSREGRGLSTVTQQRQNKAFLCRALVCVIGEWVIDRAPNSFCFTGQALVNPALLKPGLLGPGCVWLLQRSLQHSQSSFKMKLI